MALMPDEFEAAQMAETERAEQEAKKKREKEFVEKWTTSPPDLQAKMIFNILEDLRQAKSSVSRLNSYHMRF